LVFEENKNRDVQIIAVTTVQNPPKYNPHIPSKNNRPTIKSPCGVDENSLIQAATLDTLGDSSSLHNSKLQITVPKNVIATE
jgi:hypothetical protein